MTTLIGHARDISTRLAQAERIHAKNPAIRDDDDDDDDDTISLPGTGVDAMLSLLDRFSALGL